MTQWGTFYCNKQEHGGVGVHNLVPVEHQQLSVEDRLAKVEKRTANLTAGWYSMMGALIVTCGMLLYAVFTFKGII